MSDAILDRRKTGERAFAAHDETLLNDDAYYRRRLLEEEEAARQAHSNAARGRHEELAAAYRVRLRCAGMADLVPAMLGRPRGTLSDIASPLGSSNSEPVREDQQEHAPALYPSLMSHGAP